jgi:glycerol kinase
MTADRVVLALDQGTTSSRAIAFDGRGIPLATAQREFPQGFPSPGHVTHDPEDIWGSQLRVAREVVAAVGAATIVSIGVANQRETTIVWERATGRPVAPAIVWQSRITAPFCEHLRAEGHEPFIRERTGLPLDPYFSGAKIRHILEEGGLRARAERGELAFGTVDSWLVWRLTGGRIHATDVSNASRTQLLNLRTLEWDDDLLRLFEVPRAMLPEVRPSSAVWGETDADVLGRVIPIAGVAGDQQAAMSGRRASSRARRRTRSGPGRSCWRTSARRRWHRHTGCCPRCCGAWAKVGPWRTRSRARCSSPAPPCSGCGTACGRSARPTTWRSSRAAWRTPVAYTWYRRSWGSGRPGGTRTPAA